MFDSKELVVIDENGNEKVMEILFTFDNEQKNCSYVIYHDPNDEEGTVYASIYDEEGHLFEVEDESEWEMINEVFEAFVAEDTLN